MDYVGIVQFGTAIRANVGAEEALLAANVAIVSPVTSSSFRGTVWHNLLDCNARWQECLGYNIQRDVYIARNISGFRPCLLHHFRRRSDNVSSSAPKRRPDAIRHFDCKRGHSLANRRKCDGMSILLWSNDPFIHLRWAQCIWYANSQLFQRRCRFSHTRYVAVVCPWLHVERHSLLVGIADFCSIAKSKWFLPYQAKEQ